MISNATSQTSVAKIGPGRLVLVVGPSGAGKDTLINLAKVACESDGRVVFARRIITRAASDAENNEEMTPDAFHQARIRGDFVIHWEAHGLYYALPRGVDDDLRAGRAVVSNVSRTVIKPLREVYADVITVVVTAPPSVLAARLGARGRCSDGPITNRLRRQVDASSADATIENVGNADDHAVELVRIIRRL